MNIKQLLSALLSLILLSACTGERQNDPVPVTTESIDTAVEEVVDGQIIPLAQAFALQASQFQSDGTHFCGAPDAARLATLQSSWRALNARWYGLAIFNFGPLNDDIVFPKYIFIDSLRLRGTNYTETVRTEISDLLAATTALDEAYFAGLTFQKVGLLALELLAFETASAEHASDSVNIVAEYQNHPRKCEILTGMANQLIKQADAVRDGWQIEYKSSGEPFRTRFLANELDDGSDALSTLLISVQAHLDYLQARSVATVAAQIADTAWESIGASIDEVERLLEGSEQSEISLFQLMEAAGFQVTVEQVKQNIASVRAEIANEDPTMLEIELGKLDGNFKREIPSGLEVELGINFSDGD